MKDVFIAIGVTCCVATALWAHEDVQNPAVKARMDGMSAIAAHMKTLGQIAKGEIAFDAAAAKAALARIADQAAATPALFTTPETDPKSEARPEIWANFDDFTAQAMALGTVAQGFALSIEAKGDLPGVMAGLGATCTSCHNTYRE